MESGTAVPLPLYAPSPYTMLNRFATIRIPIFWMALILLKAFWIYNLVSPGWDLFWGPILGTLWLLGSLAFATLAFPRQLGIAALGMLNLCFTFLLVVDLAYWNVFGDLPSITQLSAVGQAPDFIHELPAAAGATSLLLFIDVWIWIVLLKRDGPWWNIGYKATLPLLGSALMLGVLTVWFGYSPYSDFQLRRVSNLRQVKTQGIIGYHLYDLYFGGLKGTNSFDKASALVIEKRLRLASDSISPQYPSYSSQRGRNILVVVLESFSSFPLGLTVEGEEITPFLNRLKGDSLVADCEDQTYQGVSSDGRFVLLNSLHPPSLGPLAFYFGENDFRALPEILGEEGYYTFKTLPYRPDFWNEKRLGEAYGFEQCFYEEAFSIEPSDVIGWGLSDEAYFRQLVPLLKNSPRPFFGFVITVMMHHPFAELPAEKRPLKFSAALDSTMMGRYLQLARLRDRALENFYRQLENAGLLEDTVLILVGDHRTRMPPAEFDRIPQPRGAFFDDRVLLMIHAPDGLESARLPRGCGMIDMAPTVLHLLGMKSAPRAFLGCNLLAGPRAAATRRGFVVDQQRLQRVGVGEALDLESGLVCPVDPSLDILATEQLQISDTLIFANEINRYLVPQPPPPGVSNRKESPSLRR